MLLVAFWAAYSDFGVFTLLENPEMFCQPPGKNLFVVDSRAAIPNFIGILLIKVVA